MDHVPYHTLAFLSLLVFTAVHLWAEKTRSMSFLAHGRFLSFGGGVAIAYVFLDLLPKLSKSDNIVHAARFFPYIERHVYIMALLGFLLFFAVDRSRTIVKRQTTYFWLSLLSYMLFNFMVGYAVVDRDNPEVQPLLLFTFAMGLHYFANDYAMSETEGILYDRFGKWILIASLFCGWGAGMMFNLSETAIALVSAFVGGGVIMNVMRHELPEENPNSLGAFFLSTTAYAVLLLSIGQ